MATNPSGTRAAPIRAMVTIGIAIAAIALTGCADKKDAAKDKESATVAVKGDALPPFDTAGGDTAAGLAAPILTGRDFAGKAVTIPADDGQAKAIFFVAHWCPHCQREVPRLSAWLAENQLPEGVEIEIVSTRVLEQGTTVNYPPSEWLAENGFGTTPTIADTKDDNPAYTAFGSGGLPYVVFLDKDNQVLARTEGEYAEGDDVYTDVFAALAKGEAPSPPPING